MAKLITHSRWHRTINGTELTRRREACKLVQYQFAHECGWSQPYQSQIEAPGCHEIAVGHAMAIERVLAAFSVVV